MAKSIIQFDNQHGFRMRNGYRLQFQYAFHYLTHEFRVYTMYFDI